MSEIDKHLAELELRNLIAYALSGAGSYCGDCDFEPGDRGKCADCERHWTWCADALMPVFAELETSAALVAEYRVPTTDGRWLSVRREPQGDGWAIIASHREDQWRRAYSAGRWQTIPANRPVGLFEYATAEDALRLATELAAGITSAATEAGDPR